MQIYTLFGKCSVMIELYTKDKNICTCARILFQWNLKKPKFKETKFVSLVSINPGQHNNKVIYVLNEGNYSYNNHNVKNILNKSNSQKITLVWITFWFPNQTKLVITLSYKERI